jgi:hypothetical protein
MKYKFLLSLLFVPLFILSQEKYAKEFSFDNDNDLNVSVNRDRYYTNGMFLSFRHLTTPKNENIEKRIFEWQIGHEMFTPHKSIVKTINEHDRPFAGYLYGSFGINRAYKSNKIWNTSVQLGLVGPDAYAKELQEVIHNIYGFQESVGWKHQVKNAFAFNLSTTYIDQLFTNETNNFDISWVNDAKLGTVYTNISSGFYSRIGMKPLAKIINSTGFNTNLNDDTTSFKRQIESFFYIKPTVRYAFYDATLQGSFLNTSSEVTKELIPLVFNVEVGVRFTANRFNFGYVFNYNTSKSEGLRYTYGNKFGTIAIHYLFN